LKQIRDQRILQGLHAEDKVELLDGSHGRMELMFGMMIFMVYLFSIFYHIRIHKILKRS
jgi:hypothetical protein